MGFQDFYGNEASLRRLREMLARNRFPHAVIISGPRGAGKYRLAQMLAKTMNCLSPKDSDGLPDFCGHCANCLRIAEADNLAECCAAAVEARESLREADKKDTRILVQTHPDVLIIPPDPPQMMIKVDQVRKVIQGIYYRPSQGRQRVYIFTDSSFMKEAANALLKVLEEPPEFAVLFLLTENPGELLPTIRSRCVTIALQPLPVSDIENLLSKRRADWNSRQRALVARLSGGAAGGALSFELATYITARADALALLQTAIDGERHTKLFQTTEGYRAGAEGKAKTEQLVGTIYGLLEDIVFLKSGTPELARNTDILPELKALAQKVSFEWVAAAADGLGKVERGMRRNLLRSLSLDAFAVSLEPS